MHWVVDLFRETDSVAHSVLILALVVAFGLLLGSIKLRGIGLGVAGVLFAGLAFSHLHSNVLGLAGGKPALNPEVMDFARDFGLILFVYTIGVQVGPGFLASLRKQGLPLNIMAACIVLLGAAVALILFYTVMDRREFPAVVGLFSGATTNTPSLAAAQQALRDAKGVTPEALKMPGLSYAMSYPFGIMGIIVAMLVIRRFFRIDAAKEAAAFEKLNAGGTSKLETLNLEVKNPNLAGIPLSQVPTLNNSGVVISRILSGGKPQVARADVVLRLGDVLLAVGPKAGLEQLRLIVGGESHVDVKALPSNITTRRMLVTKPEALGHSIHELDLGQRFGVTVTRINRGEVELPPTSSVKLQFGDNLVVVGEESAIKEVVSVVGDSPKRLNHPQVIPVFVGIALGVLLGSWPVHLPGMPAPVKLGLAGGPLIAAIILSRLGSFGPLVWYMPLSANFILRETGIALFLACVGLKCGDQFVATLTHGHGVQWMFCGAAITLVPLMIVAFVARAVYKVNYLTLCGMLAGSMTDPPALAFANTMAGSDAPAISYSTVYPLVMLLRVLTAQAMVMFYYSAAGKF